MAWGKRRRGKQGSSRGSSSASSSTSSVTNVGKNESSTKVAQSSSSTTDTATATAESNGTKNGNSNNGVERHHQQLEQQKEDLRLVLTSEKRRGIYECDFCHSDISQLPRIRCAVCPDFDLCLDCFATTDHSTAIARIKAAATAHSELKNDGITAGLAPGVSTAAANHDNSHGYRVCDNTRFPLFASNRNVVPSSRSGANEASPNDYSSRRNNDASRDADDNSDTRDQGDAMEQDSDTEKPHSTESTSLDAPASTAAGTASSTATASDLVVVADDPKSIWTAEEDLRLLDAILTHGLGNWVDIAEAVGGNGSVGKTARRCMERYFDDFLGRYGHILPTYTLVEIDDDDENDSKSNSNNNNNNSSNSSMSNLGAAGSKMDEDDSVRASKRRGAFSVRSTSNVSTSTATGRAKKRYKVVPTESLPGYEDVWPDPYIPPGLDIKLGKEVGRDLACKAELAFVKATTSATTKEEADNIRKEWMETRLNEIGAPTVLPPRPDDTVTLPGAELAGFMPRRGDFDIEWENDAEASLADMEFSQGDLPQDRQLKLQVLEIYSQKLDEREKRKKFIMSRKLYDYRNNLKNEEEMPADERDLVRRMRLFERFHTPEEHKIFISDILKAKRLRKEIAKLQMYRRISVRSLAEAEKYELDKSRRQFHKISQLQKEAESKVQGATSSGAGGVGETATGTTGQGFDATTVSLWKQYRKNDRHVRKSINRTGSSSTDDRSSDQTKGDDKNTASGSAEPASAAREKQDGEDASDKKLTKEEPKDSKESVPQDKMDVDGKEKDKSGNKSMEEIKSDNNPEVENEFDIFHCTGYDLLSEKEAALCVRLRLYPNQYLEIKKALIHESLTKGLLTKEGPGSGRGIIVKMDVERRGDILDFMLRAGWVSCKLATAARGLGVPPPTTPSAAE